MPAQYGEFVPILLQKYFGACPRERVQKSIPTEVRWRTMIAPQGDDAGCDPISYAIYQTTERVLQQNLPLADYLPTWLFRQLGGVAISRGRQVTVDEFWKLIARVDQALLQKGEGYDELAIRPLVEALVALEKSDLQSFQNHLAQVLHDLVARIG